MGLSGATGPEDTARPRTTLPDESFRRFPQPVRSDTPGHDRTVTVPDERAEPLLRTGAAHRRGGPDRIAGAGLRDACPFPEAGERAGCDAHGMEPPHPAPRSWADIGRPDGLTRGAPRL
ncbi:hypothetical protein ACFZAG_37600 [Streptomyces sp. NPDC012403]|uniref:hypothetical protein n=1 Tax=unclassified Streptomyces TaxID=2593676 RepID=UPI001C227E4F|nr:hypothetical protein [Streptomyces sp. AC558_RSS880]